MRAVVVAACGALAVAVTAGCSTSVSGVPNPDAAPSSPATQNAGQTAGIVRDPCHALSSGELTPITGEVRKRSEASGANGPSCLLFPEDYNKPRVTVNAFPEITNAQQLDGAKATATVWRSTRIGSKPAAQASNLANGPSRGDCRTIVSVPGSAAVGVEVQTENSSAPHFRDMCTVSDQLVGKMVR